MPTPRNHYTAQAIDGKIYAANGRTGSVFVTNASITDLVDRYDPATDTWINYSRAITDRGDTSGAVYNGRLYIAGGEYQDNVRKMAFWEVESFDPASNTWDVLPHMNVSRHGFAAAFVGNRFHVVGGSFQSDGMPGSFSDTASHEIYEVV